MIVASVLSRCSQYVIQSAGTDVPPWDVRSQYQQVHSALLYLEVELHFGRPVHEAVERTVSGLPNSHEGAMIVISYAMYHVCHCLLSNSSHLRQRLNASPVVPPLTFMRHASEDNRAHAVELSRLLGYSSTTGTAARCSFLSYCAIVSAVIHAINRNSETSGSQKQSEECLQTCSQFLANNAPYWHNSKVMVSKLRQRQLRVVHGAKHIETQCLIYYCSTMPLFTSKVSHPNSITILGQQAHTTFNQHRCIQKSWPILQTMVRSLAKKVMGSLYPARRILSTMLRAAWKPICLLERPSPLTVKTSPT